MPKKRDSLRNYMNRIVKENEIQMSFKRLNQTKVLYIHWYDWVKQPLLDKQFYSNSTETIEKRYPNKYTK